MEKTAFILGNLLINWSAVIVTVATAAALCLFLWAYLRDTEDVRAGLLTASLALVLALGASRLLHWYCYEETYGSLLAAMTDISQGGFSLTGAFAGCVAAAVLTRILRLHRSLPQMLDCMCLAGSGGIAVGRLSFFFNSGDRGQAVQSVRSMPWVYPLTNSVSGVTEYRLATFLHQAMVAGAIFLALLVFFFTVRKKREKFGDATMIFLVCYGASQIMLDSMRYDSMYFRSNGFVSIVQVLGAVALGMVVIVSSVELVRARGFKPRYLILWLVMAGLLGLAGYMEYHVQRHGNEALFAYSVMGSCLTALVVITLVIRTLSKQATRKTKVGKFQR